MQRSLIKQDIHVANNKDALKRNMGSQRVRHDWATNTQRQIRIKEVISKNEIFSQNPVTHADGTFVEY